MRNKGIFTSEAVAGKLGISKQTLFRYEKKGVFPKAKRHFINHWRIYTQEDIKKLAQILGRFSE